MAPTAPEFWCKICKLPFKTDGAFKIHKVNSDRHICCDVCGADFNSEEGKKRHRAAHHAEEQDLTCKFCGLNYPRVGSLINHYEESQCKKVSKDVFKQAIRDTMGHEQAIRKAHNFKDIRRSGDFSSQNQEPLPPFRPASTSPQPAINNSSTSKSGYANPGLQSRGIPNSGSQDGGWQNATDQTDGLPNGALRYSDRTGYGMDPPLINIIPDIPIGENEDLISFDAQSAILNSSWSVSASDVLKNTPMYTMAKDFPALGSNGDRAVVQGFSQAAGRGIAPDEVSQRSANRGPPHTWGKGVSTPIKPQVASQATHQASKNGGPPHTMTRGDAIAGVVNQAMANQISQVPPHLRGITATTTKDLPKVLVNKVSLTPKNVAIVSGHNTGADERVRPITFQVAKPSSPNKQEVQSAWGNKNLFPDAPPAIAPPAELLSSLSLNASATPAKAYRQFDPTDPSFKASRYYVELLGKWKCPYPSCNSSFKSQNGFVAHLKSSTHSDEKYQCFKCFRCYSSATALAQHAESQGVRCNVRDTDDFNSVVRGITADTATTNGRLADDTVRYEINPEAVLARAEMSQNHRAAHKARDEARLHYWENKNVHW